MKHTLKLSILAIGLLADHASAQLKCTGTVLSFTNTSKYTYVQLDTESTNRWIAGPKTALKKGDRIVINDAYEMRNFKSPSTGKHFDSIWFTGQIRKDGEPAAKALPPGHPPIAGANPHQALRAHHGHKPPMAKVAKVPPLKGGHTIAEITAQAKALDKKRVSLRARVVKVNTGILKRNWIHLRDGSGGDDSNPLTITSTDLAAVGDLVEVEGTLTLNRKFGTGYTYPLLLEKARITPVDKEP